jgi:hypothetical protein
MNRNRIVPLGHGEVFLLVPVPVRRRDQRVLIVGQVFIRAGLVEDLDLPNAATGLWDKPFSRARALVYGKLLLASGLAPFDMERHVGDETTGAMATCQSRVLDGNFGAPLSVGLAGVTM